ncbi:MAG: replication restart helicase PriA, partial [Acetobacteraceae bacterium]
MRTVAVLLPYPLTAALDYRVPDGLDPQPGALVRVPLGRREVLGVVWDGAARTMLAEPLLRPLAAVLAVPPLTAPLRRFIDWVAGYTLAPAGAVLAMTLRGFRPAAGARQKPGEAWPEADPAHPGPALSPFQAQAAARLAEASAGGFSVTLLDGVTGSGKTEVYLEAIGAALGAGRRVLVLLPEIALSAQWLERFERRFGAPPMIWHSELSPRRRRLTWAAVAAGEARVVVGARSALFLPFPALGLIVVDEEHEATFKQEEGVTYHARDMAVVRARFAGAPAILVSATPSLETLVNAERGRYRRVTLPVRHGGARLPE